MVASTNGCVTVGRAAASDNRDPQFKTSHWQFSFTVYWKGTTDKEKEDGHCPIKKRDSNSIRLNLGWHVGFHEEVASVSAYEVLRSKKDFFVSLKTF